MSELSERERISSEIHKCYCRAYERRFCKPYWTNGDYSKLDEPTKDYDREMADWHLAEVKRIIEPLTKLHLRAGTAIEVSTLNMGNILTAAQSTINRANGSE